MLSRWLKSYMPRGLYGRAALILIVPIVTIQLAVSIIFIQRHYEDVTDQMTTNVVRELSFLIGEIEAEANIEEARLEIAEMEVPLAFTGELPSNRQIEDGRVFYDLSGRRVILLLREALPQITAIDLATNDNLVSIALPTRHGPLYIEFSRKRVSASNPHQLLVLMIFVGLLMTMIAFLFLRNQLRPIKRLAAASDAFGRGQIVPYQPSGATEVRAAGGAFLNMRARIERQIEQRTRMLSGVSHDLRTPLTRMRLGLTMMEDGEDRAALETDISDMERMLDAFLAFAKGDAEDEIAEVDPAKLAREVVDRAVRGGGDVSLASSGNAGAVQLRPLAIARALENLIGNALRYGKRSEVSVSVSDRMVRFRVEDDGPGIAPEDRDEALKPFSRLEPARNQNRVTGTGLGLSIAADIARAHGGTLRLGTSDSLGGLQADLVIAR